MRVRTLAAAMLALSFVLARTDSRALPPPFVVPSPGASTVTTPTAFTDGLVKPWPDSAGPQIIALTNAARPSVSVYDNALATLVFLRLGRRADAERVLTALSQLQRDDGSFQFTFPYPKPDGSPAYVRAGAVAWVGYAATAFLDTGRGDAGRPAITAMAHRAAAYLVSKQVHAANDPRDGLVLAGEGTYRYEVDGETLRETLIPGALTFASTEHNIDAYFFLSYFARVTANANYEQAASRVARAVSTHLWNSTTGQFHRGMLEKGPDTALALDCASWGSVFLFAIGERTRAETAFAVADARYASRDPKTAVSGHVPYAHAKVYENIKLGEHFRREVPVNDWDAIEGVWAEGSAGVALAAHRLGKVARARAILGELDKLRPRGGGLPMFTSVIPQELDTAPSVTGTLWVELVRFELSRPPTSQTFWTEPPAPAHAR